MGAELTSPHGWYLVDEGDTGDVVGYAGLRMPVGSREADIQTIAVAAESRGAGRGRGLLRELLAEADHRGAAEVFLDVRDDNPAALALYRSEGFTEIGRRPGYYPGADGVVMRRVRQRSPDPVGASQ